MRRTRASLLTLMNDLTMNDPSWHLARSESSPAQRLRMFHASAALTSMDVSKDNPPTVESDR
jgi:hypothetical protein